MNYITISSLLIFGVIFCIQESFGQLQVQYSRCQTCTDNNHDDAQTVFIYDVATPFTSDQVASDFGTRDLGPDHYDWHGGVDYSSEAGNADMGDGIVAISGGTINNLDLGEGFKYITIDGADFDFGYGQYMGVNASGLHHFGLRGEFPQNLIPEDFEPRTSHYVGFHGGVDYNSLGVGDQDKWITNVNENDDGWSEDLNIGR